MVQFLLHALEANILTVLGLNSWFCLKIKCLNWSAWNLAYSERCFSLGDNANGSSVLTLMANANGSFSSDNAWDGTGEAAFCIAFNANGSSSSDETWDGTGESLTLITKPVGSSSSSSRPASTSTSCTVGLTFTVLVTLAFRVLVATLGPVGS